MSSCRHSRRKGGAAHRAVSAAAARILTALDALTRRWMPRPPAAAELDDLGAATGYWP
jgi:hypothetical protein